MAGQQPPLRGAAAPGPLVALPIQVARREITNDDTIEAYEDVKHEWPIRAGVPGVEDTFFIFDKERDDTKDYGGNLIKRQVFIGYNRVGNKRREIYHYLPAYKKYAGLLIKLCNDLQGLEHQMRHKLADYNAYMPNQRMQVPDHFTRYPQLQVPVKIAKKKMVAKK